MHIILSETNDIQICIMLPRLVIYYKGEILPLQWQDLLAGTLTKGSVTFSITQSETPGIIYQSSDVIYLLKRLIHI